MTIVGHIVRWLKYSLAFYPKWLKSILAFTHFIDVSLKVVDESSWILDFLRAEYDSDYCFFSQDLSDLTTQTIILKLCRYCSVPGFLVV